MSDQGIQTGEPDFDDDGPWYTPDNSTFGDRLAGAREATGMSRAELARKLGVKEATVQRWEDDVAEPRANKLQTVAGILGVSLRWLLTATGDGVDGPPDPEEPQMGDIREVLADIRTIRADINRQSDRLGLLEKRLRRLVRDK